MLLTTLYLETAVVTIWEILVIFYCFSVKMT